MSGKFVIENCAIATVDGDRNEYVSGYIAVEGRRIVAVGEGSAPDDSTRGARRVDASGLLATPGFVNCHHHLYQWATRGMAADSALFEWLVELYPVWSLIDEEIEYAAAKAGLASLALSGCSTSMDHHYVFPKGVGDLLAVEIEAAKGIGVRFHPTRGSMDLGQSDGGLPPDSVVESRDEILSASEDAINNFHDPSPDSMLRVALAPCSPFSVTGDLMRESAELARKKNVRLHTHLAETKDEEEFCLKKFGVRPVEYLEEFGWLGDDVWLAHCVHLDDDEVRKFGETKTGVAHCPSSNARLGAGVAPVAALVGAGAPVGLGVDGAASNESGALSVELRQAMLMARAVGGPKAMSARQALELATIHGAWCLGRESDIGSLEPGKLADVALWRMDDVGHAGMLDPVVALVFGPPKNVETLFVNGEAVVEEGELKTSDEREVARGLEAAAKRLIERTEVTR